MIATGDYLRRLEQAEGMLPWLLRQAREVPGDGGRWQSLLIDYEPPKVERLWLQVGDSRIYLHRIYPCAKALFHAHPWPSAVRVLDGGYRMGVGFGQGDAAPPIAATLVLGPGSTYEMIHPDGWHYVRPLGGPSYSVMVTGPPWERSSPGKDIEHVGLSDDVRDELLLDFQMFYPQRQPSWPPGMG